jgi:N-acyl-D-amino-acid deacylase
MARKTSSSSGAAAAAAGAEAIATETARKAAHIFIAAAYPILSGSMIRPTAVFFLALACTARPDTPGAAAGTAAGPSREYDLIVAGGEVLDGTGAAALPADIGIRGDTITAIGDLEGAHATTVLRAEGRTVAPGFIDLLGNSQAAVLIDPSLEGKIRQGVTTEVTGEGHSPGPIDDAMAAEMERTKPEGWPAVSWRTLGQFGEVVARRGTALNFAFYVGATNPREMVLGHQDRAPTADELRRMVAIVEQARREGAVGLASALIYPPGRFAREDELAALARAAGSYWTHLRNEASAIDEAIDEAVRIARKAGVPLNILHLKVGGKANWGRMPAIVRRIEKARASGIDVAACVYPYTATSTALTSIVPAWALEGTYGDFVGRLRDPATRARIAAALEGGRLAGRGAKTILVRGIPSETMKRFERKRLDEIAAEMRVGAAEAALRLFEESRSSPIGIYFSLDEADMKHALRQRWVAVCSDSGAVVGTMRNSGAHPRAYATFARILRQYVREERLIPLEEAVRKMTSLAAGRARLHDRGTLRVGMKADVVVFDPAAVRDVSTYEDPHHFSEGVAHVVVNGAVVLQDGRMTGKLPGRILHPSDAAPPGGSFFPVTVSGSTTTALPSRSYSVQVPLPVRPEPEWSRIYVPSSRTIRRQPPGGRSFISTSALESSTRSRA